MTHRRVDTVIDWRVHITYFISSQLTSYRLNWVSEKPPTQFAVAATNHTAVGCTDNQSINQSKFVFWAIAKLQCNCRTLWHARTQNLQQRRSASLHSHSVQMQSGQVRWVIWTLHTTVCDACAWRQFAASSAFVHVTRFDNYTTLCVRHSRTPLITPSFSHSAN